ncbi:DsbA family oxidoreductase [Clostridium hydrogenum]|uniref:DsbA family oxidoreductase n=1 Tax=Clostridium hydrogenum TaxID=2855764 RepID=UPI001F239FD8|nr:DsbA family oxidoreductase [Clostridium hydrogenum]
MKIEVWSDFVCPFCYIGKRRLEEAVKNFEYKEEVELVFRSFELDKDAKKKYDENINEIIAKKYDIPVEEAKSLNDQIVLQAKAVGLNYNFDGLIPTNTFDAHRLLQYAKTKGRANELEERILKAYFVESLDISNYEILAKLAFEVGLDSNEALKILEFNEYGEEVRKDEEKALKLKVSGVPYFVFDNKYAVSGAQPSEVFLEALQKVKKEELSSKLIEVESENKDNEASKGANCSDGKCRI